MNWLSKISNSLSKNSSIIPPKLYMNRETRLRTCKKYYRSHIWVTDPDEDGISEFGLSDWARHYLCRICLVNSDRFPRTLYSIPNREKCLSFLKETQERRKNNTLRMAEQMQLDRFFYRQGQSFTVLQTTDFDIELQAPVDMFIYNWNIHIQYDQLFLRENWVGELVIVNPQKLESDTISEEQYLKAPKFFELQ